jgi:hypothetical protein
MKNRIISMLFVCMLITLTGGTARVMPSAEQLTAVQFQPAGQGNNLSIIQSVTEVSPGGIGYITIQGLPRERYLVTSSFKIGRSTRSVSQWRVTDERGQATFVWAVNQNTVPGTYTVTISGGGETINTYHRVLER